FGIDISVKYFGVSDTSARIDHLQIKVYYTESTLTQDSGISRPDGDVTAEWESSHAGDHADLINETTLDTNDYIYTSSIASNNITDEFSMGTFDILSSSVTEIQIKVYGKEILDIDSTVNVYCGTWLGPKQLDMSSTPVWHSYSWSGLDLTQSNW
ncbi:unnamed protein product, partial [marine sediment metagenome]